MPGGPATAWRSAILKSPLPEAMVGALGLHGDAQKEKRHHGGPLKAVLVYGTAHYDRWDASLAPHAAQHADLLRTMSSDVDASTYGPGAFGENITVDGLTEATVCLGDLWQLGSCVLRITEPRGPCATLTRRWMRPELLREVRTTAAAGWYNAVHTEGSVAIGDAMTLVQRVQDEWTMERVFRMVETPTASRIDIAALRDHPVTHEALRARLTRRLAARR
ncbi:MAG TPA: MOSC domain-containing protein [Gemmatimonadaceae bacterium]|nr:MOSC domain-containing protein [Gemmatimonadaceae bacterium]